MWCFTFFISYKDWDVLERSSGQKRTREESLGRQSHQKVRGNITSRATWNQLSVWLLSIASELILSLVPGIRSGKDEVKILLFWRCRFIKGYMTRHEASTTDNSEYLTFVRHSYLTRLKNKLPKTVLDKTTWLAPPPVVKEVRMLLIVKMTSSWKSEFSGVHHDEFSCLHLTCL